MDDITNFAVPLTGEPQSIVSFHGVAKAFGENVVYEDLTMDIHRGETLTVIGASGTGKSVMLKMLIGLLDVDEGDILYEGNSLIGLSEEEFLPIRRNVSMLFQSAALFDSLTVGENIAFPLEVMGGLDDDDIQRRVQEKLVLVGLAPEVTDMKPAELSGGMKKRVGLARAIATDPKIILYDEPTTGLDPINTSRISRLIVSLQRKLGITSVVVTHEMRLAFEVSNRIAMLYDKRILLVDSPQGIRDSNLPQVRNFVDGNFSDEDESLLHPINGQ